MWSGRLRLRAMPWEDFLTWTVELTRMHLRLGGPFEDQCEGGPLLPLEERVLSLIYTWSSELWYAIKIPPLQPLFSSPLLYVEHYHCNPWSPELPQLRTGCRKPCLAAAESIAPAAKLPQRLCHLKQPQRPLIARRTRLLNPLACAPPLLCNAVPPSKYWLLPLRRPVAASSCRAVSHSSHCCRVERRWDEDEPCRYPRISITAVHAYRYTSGCHLRARLRKSGKRLETPLVHTTSRYRVFFQPRAKATICQSLPQSRYVPEQVWPSLLHSRCHGDRCALEVEALSS